MDIEYNEFFCGGDNCTCDYVEISGQKYCGTSLPEPSISCSVEVIFQSDFSENYPGFRAEWTAIPDEGE